MVALASMAMKLGVAEATGVQGSSRQAGQRTPMQHWQHVAHISAGAHLVALLQHTPWPLAHACSTWDFADTLFFSPALLTSPQLASA